MKIPLNHRDDLTTSRISHKFDYTNLHIENIDSTPVTTAINNLSEPATPLKYEYLTCIRCKQSKPESEFYALKSDRRSYYCKECHRSAATFSYKNNKIKYFQTLFEHFNGNQFLDPVSGPFHPLIFLQLDRRTFKLAIQIFNEKYRYPYNLEAYSWPETIELVDRIKQSNVKASMRREHPYNSHHWYITRKFCQKCKRSWPTYFGSLSPFYHKIAHETFRKLLRIDACFVRNHHSPAGWSKYCKLCITKHEDIPAKFYLPSSLPKSLLELIDESEIQNEYEPFMKLVVEEYQFEPTAYYQDFQNEAYKVGKFTYSNTIL